jgi:adenylosuccinate synthase
MMQDGRVNFVVDAFWGSSGKGKLSAWLCEKYGVRHSSAANYPNAGHTVVKDGKTYVFKVLPSAAVLEGMTCYLTPGAGFERIRLAAELDMCPRKTHIHNRAVIVTESHKAEEQEKLKRIASTMQGSGAAMSAKLMRTPDARLARDIDIGLQPQAFRDELRNALADGGLLHEVSQGFALSIDHGTSYPYCTSRNCTPQQALDYLGLPFSTVGDVWLNIRPYPIRVGNVVEDGVEVGVSGPFPFDCQEVTWDYIAKASGMPGHVAEQLADKERTTVTKRVRRVCTFSWDTLNSAVRVCGATVLALNFAQYIDWRVFGVRGQGYDLLTDPVRKFIDDLEERTNRPVLYVGTGPDHKDVVTP